MKVGIGPLSTEEFEVYLSEKARLIDDRIAKALEEDGDIPNLHDAMTYSMGLDVDDRKMRGKRIRPALCLLSCESLGEETEKAIPFAISCEFLHNFLLVHDDIEDGDEKRRERESVWAKYGMEHGINVGDYLFAKTYENVMKSKDVGVSDRLVLQLVDLITRTIVRTGEGQAMDLNARRSERITVRDYMLMVQLKTGYYLAASVQGGAIIAGAPSGLVSKLEEFGRYVGPVFQIADDILDMTKSKGRGEKGSDVKEGKRSLLVVLTAESASRQEKRELFRILDKPRAMTTEEDVERVFSLFEKYDSVERARHKAMELLKKGVDSISGVKSPLRENLTTVADYMISRSW